MSSDSDLDFESADEDASYDDNSKNNNTSQQKHEVECSNKDSDICIDSAATKLCGADLCENIANEEQNDKTGNVDNNAVNETKTSHLVSQKNLTEEYVHEVFPKDEMRVSEDNRNKENKSLKSSSDVSFNKNQQEKQRVTLRLEKKIQQKNQMMKDGSVEKDTNSNQSSETLPKQHEVKVRYFVVIGIKWKKTSDINTVIK